MNLQPLVSVVIPCYNHAHYLREAVESVKQQTYQNVEIIIVDDGSTDETSTVSKGMESITYIFQDNQGLSAARNAGFQRSKGEYIVFLDADDYLYAHAIESNLRLLQGNPSWAFVSGWHDKVDDRKNKIPQDVEVVVQHDHYIQLLQGNYIGMHATVMYTRWVLEDFRFDTTLKACEDYDLYLRIARKYAVGNHNKKIAAYRIHHNNMSANIPFMLDVVLKVQQRQKPFLKDGREIEALKKGQRIWKDYYAGKLYQTLRGNVIKRNQVPFWKERQSLIRIDAKAGIKTELSILKLKMKKALLKRFPKLMENKSTQDTSSAQSIRWADLERLNPFSEAFGFDRGGPVDRYYIEKFLYSHRDAVKGRVLEITDNTYTLRFGEARVTKSDVLNVAGTNETVTIVGDLCDAPQIPSEIFDCIILTQTLQYIFDLRAALQTCFRILKKEGVLLLTVPGISQIEKGEWKESWYWSFTDKSIRKLLLERFQQEAVHVQTFGNVYTATAFLYGIGLPEVRKDFLDEHDPSYQVIVAARAMK